jgi:hypothetical protein
VDDSIKTEVIHWAAHYNHRMELGSKPIFHIEAFIAKFMAMSTHTLTHSQHLPHLWPLADWRPPPVCVSTERSYKRFIVETFG